MDERGSPILFTEYNSHETMRITAGGHTWFLCDHGWRYCTDCNGWPCGEPEEAKTHCEKCVADSPFQVKAKEGSSYMENAEWFMAGMITATLIAIASYGVSVYIGHE